MPGLYGPHKVYMPGEVLTAADLNATDQTHIVNQTPQMTDDYQLDLAQKRTQTDPASGLATSLAGDIAQLRYALAKVARVQFWDTIVGPPTVGLRGYINGFRLVNNGSDINNDIAISAGAARSEDNTTDMNLAATLIKKLNGAWAVGTNQGMLDGGAKVANTWYHLFVIERLDTENVDILASTSSGTPTMPLNYSKRRRIGAIRTDAAGNIMQFVHDGRWILWKDPPKDVDVTNLSTARTLYTLTVPTGFKFLVLLNAYLVNTAESRVYVCQPDMNDEAPSVTDAPFQALHMAGTQDTSGQITVMTNTSGQIACRSSAANTTFRAATLGYEDQRGADM